MASGRGDGRNISAGQQGQRRSSLLTGGVQTSWLGGNGSRGLLSYIVSNLDRAHKSLRRRRGLGHQYSSLWTQHDLKNCKSGRPLPFPTRRKDTGNGGFAPSLNSSAAPSPQIDSLFNVGKVGGVGSEGGGSERERSIFWFDDGRMWKGRKGIERGGGSNCRR